MYGDALTTIIRIKNRLGITVTEFDTLLTNLILGITAGIESICGRRFIQAQYTNEIHDGSDFYNSNRRILIPKNAPIQAIASVQYKGGSNSTPLWTSFSEDDYDLDEEAGLLYFRSALPRGKRNIRITYTAGFSGYSIGVNNFWFFNITPTGAVNGSNRVFTIPEDASQIIVYVDGMREASANITFTVGTATFTLAVGREPYSTIAVDYLRENAAEDSDLSLPLELVEVAEKAVIRTFKKRDSEGRTSEAFRESSTSWEKDVFTEEDQAIIRNFRRGYDI
jgi:hypothetical protein